MRIKMFQTGNVTFSLVLSSFLMIFCESQILEVVCPTLKNGEKDLFAVGTVSKKPYNLISSTEYCQCNLYVTSKGRTAIVKCDFKNEKDIILSEGVLDFRKLNATSAYVRMTNTRSTKITSTFLKSWMDSPSSALDLWYCGNVSIEGTKNSELVQTFPKLKTFVGIGVIQCNLDEIPANLLRDRSRGAIRIKSCNIGTIREGLLLNIEEIRYMVIEDSVIGNIKGPLSTSGTMTLSKKHMHSWDGLIIKNTTIEEISQNAFNVTHMSDTETVTINRCRIGKLGKESIQVTGDIDVLLQKNNLGKIDSFAIKTSVTGRVVFSENNISSFQADSFFGLQCQNESAFSNNSFQVIATDGVNSSITPFKGDCSAVKVIYNAVGMMRAKSVSGWSNFTTYFFLGIFVVGGFLTLTLYWGWRNKYINPFQYKRSDTPLFEGER